MKTSLFARTMTPSVEIKRFEVVPTTYYSDAFPVVIFYQAGG